MPTYEYRCAKGHQFELFQRITDKPRARCPECGARATRAISGGAGLIFKGSGFYITDYGKDGKGPRQGEAAEKPAAAGDAGAPAKADAPAQPEAPGQTKGAGSTGSKATPGRKTGPKDPS